MAAAMRQPDDEFTTALTTEAATIAAEARFLRSLARHLTAVADEIAPPQIASDPLIGALNLPQGRCFASLTLADLAHRRPHPQSPTGDIHVPHAG